MLWHIFRFQDKKWRMHSPDTAKKTTITRYYPPQRQPPRPRQLALKQARLRLRLEQQPRVLVLAAILGQLHDLVDERHGWSPRAEPASALLRGRSARSLSLPLNLRFFYPSPGRATKWYRAPLAGRGNPKKRYTGTQQANPHLNTRN